MVTVISRFLARFDCTAADGYDDESIIQAETSLDVTFPKSYRTLLSTVGYFDCPTLLSYAIEKKLDVPILQTCLPLNQVKKVNEDYHEADMPEDYWLFGLDPGGSAFCYRTIDAGEELFYFDHELATISPLSDSLEDFLRRYIK